MDKALPLLLKELRLPSFVDQHIEIEQKATKQAWSYSQYLAKLCEQEIAQRYQSRIARWTHEAKLPPGKSFETLAIDQLPKPVQKQVIALRENTQWALQADNVLLIGPSGVGKSHIAAALALQLIGKRQRIRVYCLFQKLEQLYASCSKVTTPHNLRPTPLRQSC